MSMNSIVIVGARRTPQGRFLGELSGLTAVDLALAAGRAAMGDAISPQTVDHVILGNVLGAGEGMNIGRQVGVKSGLPIGSTGITINMMCASGLHAIALAAQAIDTGQSRVVLCGGTESMSTAPYLAKTARAGFRLGDAKLVDSLICDGLTDPFSRTHMGLTAETLADDFRISREEQDQYALRSQQRYQTAAGRGAYDPELIPVGKLERDEHPRPTTTLEKLATLKPTFLPDGTVTAGNASGINDGAALLIVCQAAVAEKYGWPKLARISGYAAAGCDPARMGLGPVHATRKLCRRYRYELRDFDAIELNEAFAAQALACIRELELPAERVNPDGGAIALGHPIGATGARLVTHLAHRIARGEIRRGLATLCVGGGMGAAMALESAAAG